MPRSPWARVYRTILADPPWKHTGGGGRGAQEHYPVLSTPEIIQTMLTAPCWRPARTGAHLWLWCPNNWLEDGMLVMRSLGFRYVTNHLWAKDRFGIGRYGRGQHELVLFGTMGRKTKPLTRAKATGTVIGGQLLPRREHSRKPDEQYRHIEGISRGPRLEMFARPEMFGRRRRRSWDFWGNELLEETPRRKRSTRKGAAA